MEQGVVHSNDCAEVHQIMDEEHSWLFTCFKCGGSPGRKSAIECCHVSGKLLCRFSINWSS